MKVRSLIALALGLVLSSLSPLSVSQAAPERRTAVFAGGCFWSVQKVFDHVPGVVDTRVGFIGGHVDKPTYNQVARDGNTGHYEGLEVVYDPKKVSYETLLSWFWHNIDPTDRNGQICDKGPHYRTAIFVTTETELKAAQRTKAEVAQKLKKPVATAVIKVADLKLKAFYPAEAYHQHYWKTHKVRYEGYAIGCGRERTLKAVWGIHYKKPPFA